MAILERPRILAERGKENFILCNGVSLQWSVETATLSSFLFPRGFIAIKDNGVVTR